MATDDGIADDFLDPEGTPEPDGLNFAHDENGNQIDDGRHALSYDAFNRLVGAARHSDGLTVAIYKYDALGRRVTREAEIPPAITETRRYLYAGARVVEERDLGSGGVTTQIVHGRGGPLWQLLPDGTAQYLLEDPFGSIVALFDSASPGAGVLERMTYDPHGKPQFENPDNSPRLDRSGNFAAYSHFTDTYLWRGLWYDPELGERTSDVNTDWGGYYGTVAWFASFEGNRAGSCYTIFVEMFPAPIEEFEPNDDPGSATDLGILGSLDPILYNPNTGKTLSGKEPKNQGRGRSVRPASSGRD